MRIVIDLQGAQTSSRFRGIGRYALSFALAIARNANHHEIWLVLNSAFPQSILKIREEFDDLIPQNQIRIFEVPTSVSECDISNTGKARAFEQIREYFLEQLDPDIVLLTSLFEGYVDDAVTSVKRFSSIKTAVILHDLIPYLAPTKYLATDAQQKHYARKIDSLKNGDLFLCNSQATKQEAIDALALQEDKMVNISAAVDKKFHTMKPTQEESLALAQKYSITRNIVMYAPGGFDERKNIDGLIKAYARLPQTLRETHQLLIASKIDEEEKTKLLAIAREVKLKKDELIITGYIVDEELIGLYALATLFVFPSKHEGFGLPALEAMSCGAATIGSDATSIPEVIGWKKALFDPHSVTSISQKMQEALQDEDFLRELREHALEQSQKFSWDESAKKALMFIEDSCRLPQPTTATKKPTMAYFSPLPPLKSGISDYSKELIEYLSDYYDLTLIVDPEATVHQMQDYEMQTAQWFLQNFKKFDRNLYHLGNSNYHSYMLPILKEHPGVVILHDFFMSGMLSYEEIYLSNNNWSKALYDSHGYMALKERFLKDNMEAAKIKYPCNLKMLQDSLGTIVHSEYSNRLAKEWYGNHAESMRVIPLLRIPAQDASKETLRKKLSIRNDAFVICSFGFLDSTKLNHVLLEAFISSNLASDTKSYLIFVGENHGGDYGVSLLSAIKNSKLKDRILITGWTDAQTFKEYLTVADIGVQLRTLSRGETSAAALDCMNYGLPTIVNANGSMADLPNDAVYKLEDQFSKQDLIEALETLYLDESQRLMLSLKAKELISTRHAPQVCAQEYFNFIESTYSRPHHTLAQVVDAIADTQELLLSDAQMIQIAEALSLAQNVKMSKKQLLVDVSSIVRTDLHTGIERVVRAQLLELIKNAPNNCRVEAVYLEEKNSQKYYKYAREYTYKILDIPYSPMSDEIVEVANGDIYYCADFFRDGVIELVQSGLYTKWRATGVSINFLVYDLLPVLSPGFFPKDSHNRHILWLKSIADNADSLICISQSVADELKVWLKSNNQKIPNIFFNHLGADIDSSAPTKRESKKSEEVLELFKLAPTFLMVGTIEPRKGHLQVIASFEELWRKGHKVNLVIVGNEGWKTLPQNERSSIPQIVKKLRTHPQLNKRLFWLEGVSDDFLEKTYAASTALIAASEGEGFGLPLIEAAQHSLALIVRDIPVFKEVAGEYAYYFANDNDPNILVQAIEKWLALYATSTHPTSASMPWLTWKQNTQQLLGFLKCLQN